MPPSMIRILTPAISLGIDGNENPPESLPPLEALWRVMTNCSSFTMTPVAFFNSIENLMSPL